MCLLGAFMQNIKETMINHSWRYFELHATQRISLIRYYIGIYSLYISACGYMLFHDAFLNSNDKYIIFALSILILIITTIFYLLDRRNRDLIHLAEESLRQYEFEMGFQNPHNIFTLEDVVSRQESKFRHTHCFNALFLVGIISALTLLMLIKSS
jgi:hypothetical protein